MGRRRILGVLGFKWTQEEDDKDEEEEKQNKKQ
jgi:hypothetical protein